MLQAIIKKGKVFAENIPAPIVSDNTVLIKVVNSCISAGTEISCVNTSKKSIIKIAMEQPEQVKRVFNMVKNNGISDTVNKVRTQLEDGKPTGYSISGVVIAVGKNVEGFLPGDKVAAAGAGIANHAEYVEVPVNLIMKMSQNLNFIEASTVTLGGIAMQGVRRVDLRIGEYCVVIGAGILGLLAIQMLAKSGIRVAAVDLDTKRLDIAKKLGCEIVINPLKEDSLKAVENWTGGFGADAVLFTASTSSNEPLSQSFHMCRRKGKVVMVGVSGMQINRADMYAKELDFVISTSYGPGRYDRNYEEKGLDYPYAYVRWTENRNMQEYLRLLESKTIKLDSLIEAVYKINEVDKAFDAVQNKELKPLMVILDYGEFEPEKLDIYKKHERKVIINTTKIQKEKINVALVGTGGFATGMHLPNMQKLKDMYNLHAVMNRTGHKAKIVASKYNAAYSTTNFDDILNDENIDLVFICTRHDSHAELTLKALKAGKNVFVEKPLAVNQEELNAIKEFYENDAINKPLLMVGFNRRFSTYANEIKKHTNNRINPLFIQYRMNAGYIPQDHWVHEHGGRVVGECCHIIDLMNYLTESEIKSINVESLQPTNSKFSISDNKSIILKYNDGSICNIQYFSTGAKELSKEYMEVHFDGKSIILDDYKELKGYGIKINSISSLTSEKGQLEELVFLYKSLKGNIENWPIEYWDLIQTTQTTFMINSLV